MSYTSQDITFTPTRISYPVSVGEAIYHLRVEDDDNEQELNYINSLVIAATHEAENYIQKDLAKTRYLAQMWDFTGSSISINKGNLNEIESITNSSDASISYDTNSLRHYYSSFYLALNSGTSSDPLNVTFTCGYNQDSCPQEIKQAILLKIKTYYDPVRDDYTRNDSNMILGGIKTNGAFERLLAKHKNIRF